MGDGCCVIAKLDYAYDIIPKRNYTVEFRLGIMLQRPSHAKP